MPLLMIVPAKLTVLGTVAVKPPPKVVASEEADPNCNVPLFVNVTELVITFVGPVIERL